MKYLTLVLSTLLVFSCAYKDEKALKKVEELQHKVDSLETVFKAVDEDAVHTAKKQYNESIALIKKYYFKDTVDLEFMNNIDFYRGIKTANKTIGKNKTIIAENFEVEKELLSNLKQDLENQSIQGEEVQSALTNETKNVQSLDSAVTLYIQNTERILFIHDSIADYIKTKTLNF